MINDGSNEIGKSIQPVITKCDPNGSKLDMDVIRFNLDKQLMNHVKNLKTQA